MKKTLVKTPRVQFRCIVGRLLCAVALPWLPVFAQTAFALQPGEIALVVNSNVPDGVALAQFYAQQRHIPDNRILVLDLPKSDQMSCRQYEDQVVPQVRDFLHTSHLESKLKCLVTFYGVPLRIDQRVNTPEEDAELAEVRRQAIALPEQIRPPIEALEGLAKKLNPSFVPEQLTDMEHLEKRRVTVFREILNQLKTVADKNRQAQFEDDFFDLAQPLLGDTARLDKMSIKLQAGATTGPVNPDGQLSFTQAKKQHDDLVAEALSLENLPDDAQARTRLRQIVQDNFGSLQLMRLLGDQADYLDPNQSGASFDSELAMVEWKAYQHKAFITNPLHYGYRAPNQWPTLMVMRLDAPQPETVKAMIATSIKVEQEGLTGQLVIDSLGIKPGQDSKDHPGYGEYDQHLHDLYDLAHLHTKLKILLDDKPEVLPPGSADQVAMYCGWYSVHNYIPSCKFNPGAVGFHIASYELLSLRQPGETGWVHGLINDGVVGTLGSVAEPYLGAFPRPDDFFPLLMTGKLTLAEVYWRTEPTVSWMMDCVGDPLYTPYKKNPPFKVADLPPRLRLALPAAPAAGAAIPYGLPPVRD